MNEKKVTQKKKFEKLSVAFRALTPILKYSSYSQSDIKGIQGFCRVAEDFLKNTPARRYAGSKALLANITNWLGIVDKCGLDPIYEKDVRAYFGEMSKLADVEINGKKVKMENVLIRYISGFYMTVNVEKTKTDKQKYKKALENINTNASIYSEFMQKMADLVGEEAWKRYSGKMSWIPQGENNYLAMRGLRIQTEAEKQWFKKN